MPTDLFSVSVAGGLSSSTGNCVCSTGSTMSRVNARSSTTTSLVLLGVTNPKSRSRYDTNVDVPDTGAMGKRRTVTCREGMGGGGMRMMDVCGADVLPPTAQIRPSTATHMMIHATTCSADDSCSVHSCDGGFIYDYKTYKTMALILGTAWLQPMEEREPQMRDAYDALVKGLEARGVRERVRICVVENSLPPGSTSFLDDLYGKDNVLYTGENRHSNIGNNELDAVRAALKHWPVPDNHLVIKWTARYIVDADSPFIRALATLIQHKNEKQKTEEKDADKEDEAATSTRYDAILRWGAMWSGADRAQRYTSMPTNATRRRPLCCCTGIIAMRRHMYDELQYVRSNSHSIEWQYANAVARLPAARVHTLPVLGLTQPPKRGRPISLHV